MDTELSELEQKLDELLALCAGLRAENRELRTRLATLEVEKRRLDERVDAARGRLETLIERLPQP